MNEYIVLNRLIDGDEDLAKVFVNVSKISYIAEYEKDKKKAVVFAGNEEIICIETCEEILAGLEEIKIIKPQLPKDQ